MSQPIVPPVFRFVPGDTNARAMTRFPAVGATFTAPGAGLSVGDLDLYRCDFAGTPMPIPGAPGGPSCVTLLRASQNLQVTAKDGPTMMVPAGHLTLMRNCTDHLFRFRGPTRIIGIVAPADLLTAFSVPVPATSLTTYANATLTTPMWQFVESVIEQPVPWPSLSAYFAEKLLHEMIGSVLLDAAGTSTLPTPNPSLVERARHHITAYACDPRLSPLMVARSLDVPLRRLQRRFSEVGTSVAQEIRIARARATVAVLQAPEGSLMDLEAVAEHCGYPNAVSLRRAFAALGMASPSHYRASAARASAARASSATRLTSSYVPTPYERATSGPRR